MRTFLAIPLPPLPSLRRCLETLQGERGLRCAALEHLHLTLKFFGETQPDDLPHLCDAIETAVEGTQLVELHVRELGAFPHLRRPSVLWAGIEPDEHLSQLVERIESVCDPLGFPREKRAYRPHVTLARIHRAPPPGLSDWIRDQSDNVNESFAAEEIVLFESVVSRRGANYARLASWQTQ